MHPHFAELVRYCKGKFLDYKINTNASLLNEEKILAMLDACHTVVFSIDSIKNYLLETVDNVYRNYIPLDIFDEEYSSGTVSPKKKQISNDIDLSKLVFDWLEITSFIP